MKAFIPVLLSLTLVACGGGDGNGITVDGTVLTFTGGNETARIDRTDQYTVLVPSSMNHVTIATKNTLSQLGVTGSNNAIVLEDSVTVKQMSLGGANNSLTMGANDSVPELDVPGSNAAITIGPGTSVGTLHVSGGNDTVTIQSLTTSVPVILLTGSNAILRIPAGYASHTKITNTGANNQVIEQ